MATGGQEIGEVAPYEPTCTCDSDAHPGPGSEFGVLG